MKSKRYNAKKTGKYRSKFEAYIARTAPKRKGVKIEYETKEIKYSVPHSYYPDFTITLPGGREIIVEVKGYFRPEDKVKMRGVKESNPFLDIRFVFPKADKRSENWCKKYNFPYAIGRIPKEWFND